MGDAKQRQAKKRVTEVPDELARGRQCYAASAWAEAFASLSQADKEVPLNAADLELLATSAYLVGQDGVFLDALDRAHGAYLSAGETTCAARCAFWLGLSLLFMGETGRGTGWLAGARRLIEGETADCAERGYLLLPTAEQLLGADDYDTAYATAADAVEIGDRFGEADLVSCARHLQGRALMGQGRVEEGLALLDEAMIAVTAGQLSPLMTGLIYCSVIDACQQVYALARAWEWTAALTRWCEAQPQMVAFTGTCLGIAPRSCSCTAIGGMRSKRRDAPASLAPRGPSSSPRPWPSTSKRRCIACEASSRRLTRRTKTLASGVVTHSRAWLYYGWPRDAPTLQPQRSAVL